MREPTREELLKTPPPELRVNSKTSQAYLEMRRKILSGEYSASQHLIPKQIEETYQVNNTTTQMLLMRLANEGLVTILPVRERTWPNNASLNEYRVADLTQAQKVLASRLQAELPASTTETSLFSKETLLLTIQYADEEIAGLLGLAPGEKVVVYRERERRPDKTVTAISDWYAPFWFAEMIPELEQPENDVYRLLQRLGKHPTSCTETVDIVQARSVERILFERSPDDPAPLFKLRRITFDAANVPLAIQFLTASGENYRLQYTLSLT
jgi:DNA-binding GntR family transcriptional regulator